MHFFTSTCTRFIFQCTDFFLWRCPIYCLPSSLSSLTLIAMLFISRVSTFSFPSPYYSSSHLSFYFLFLLLCLKCFNNYFIVDSCHKFKYLGFFYYFKFLFFIIVLAISSSWQIDQTGCPGDYANGIWTGIPVFYFPSWLTSHIQSILPYGQNSVHQSYKDKIVV